MKKEKTKPLPFFLIKRKNNLILLPFIIYFQSRFSFFLFCCYFIINFKILYYYFLI